MKFNKDFIEKILKYYTDYTFTTKEAKVIRESVKNRIQKNK